MIDKAILKKHNLKGVPFSCIREGESFILEVSFADNLDFEPYVYARKIEDGSIFYVTGPPDFKVGNKTDYHPSFRVYVPVWRVCKPY